MNRIRKYIVSASRRNDMLACQPERLLKALNGEFSNTRKLKPERVHTLLISTKDYRNILDNVILSQTVAKCDQVIVNLTITGLGGTVLEPNVPGYHILLKRLPELVSYVGDPRRIIWCFDPVLTWNDLSNMSLQLFTDLLEAFNQCGVKRVMGMYYYPYKNARIRPEIISDDEKKEFADSIDHICCGLNMGLSFCHVKPYHRYKCVDLDLYEELHPLNEGEAPLYYKKVKKANANYCRDSIWDIGWYFPSCEHGCLYCYGKAV